MPSPGPGRRCAVLGAVCLGRAVVRLATVAAAFFIAIPSPARSATIHVPGDQPTIQAGIDAADPGDVVLVASGTYTGIGNKDLVFHGEAITVRSETRNPSDCIIDCEASGRGFFISGPDVDLVVEGFTVTNGSAFPGGGAQILAECTLRHCVFMSCIDGAVSINGPATLESCSFLGNISSRGGGVSFVHNLTELATLTDCVIAGNSAFNDGGGVVAHSAYVLLRNCLIVGNEASNGGGVSATNFSDMDIIACTITGNTAQSGGGAGGVFVDSDETTVSVNNSIISFSPEGQGIIDYSTKGWPPTCTNVFGNARGDWPGGSPPGHGYGNFSADPLFCDPDAGDFTLHSDSPCLPGNHPDGADCGLIGALPQGCGPVSIEELSWGRIKSVYRDGER